jgi:hypothetical protein
MRLLFLECSEAEHTYQNNNFLVERERECALRLGIIYSKSNFD